MIRKIEEQDVDRVMEIWLTTNIAAHSFLPEKYWTSNYDIVKNEVIPESETWVYEENEIIKGFIGIVEENFVGALFVDGEYRGEGIGKALIDRCKSMHDSLKLAVYGENKSAIGFYKKCGLEIIKEQSNPDSGFMEYIMEWKRK